MTSDIPPEELGRELDGLEDSFNREVVADLKDQLDTLSMSVDQIPSSVAPPQTTLQIQGQADVKAAWQNYLSYFLDLASSHGLGNDALLSFLQGINDVTSQNFPIYAGDDVEVKSEIGSPEGNYLDIIIESPEKFFVCCELKLYSSEGEDQTDRYVNDSHVGGSLKSEFPESGHHYVYIRRPGHPSSSSDDFIDITWRQVEEWFRSLLTTTQGRYPARTTIQLTDFLDTIQQDMTENEHIKTARKKMELFFNHQDAISEVENGVVTVHKYEENNWRRKFIDEYLPDNWSKDWHTNPSKWGQIYHSRWRQDDALKKDGTIKLHFVHLIRDIDSFKQGELTFQLRWPEGPEYRERFKTNFKSDRFSDKLDSRLGEFDINKTPDYSYKNPRFIEKKYPVTKSELLESYYETLQQAVKEHIEVSPVINEILETTIQEVEN